MKQEEWKGKAVQKNLYEILEKIDVFFDLPQVSPRKLLALKIAFEEMFVNVAKYAYPESQYGEEEKKINVLIKWKPEDGEARIQIMDRGLPYDPLKAGEPDLSADIEKRSVGGLGIHMAREMTDELQYLYQDGKNKVTIVKILTGN